MSKSPAYNFHDQKVSAFSLEERKISLIIECFEDDENTYKPVTFLFEGVHDLIIDKIPATSLSMFNSNGEMVHFELKNNKAFFLIEWDNFHNHKHVIKSYRFSYSSEKIIDDKRKTDRN